MLADRVRAEAHLAAVAKAVRPGDTVCDLGSGTGVFAIAACRAGARKVYAVEPAAVIGLGREPAAAAGCADKIEFVQGSSFAVRLPEKVDVMISDLRGVLPYFGRHLPAMADARERFLRPGGRMLPIRDDVWAAPVEADAEHRKLVAPWIDNAYGLRFAAGLRAQVNQGTRRRFDPNALLADAAMAASVEYATFTSYDLEFAHDFAVARAGRCAGLAMWFDAELSEGVWMKNRPGEPDTIYTQLWLPVESVFEVKAGDTLRCELSAKFAAEDYVWSWTLRLLRGGNIVAEPRQHSLAAELLGGVVRPVDPAAQPGFSEEAQIDLLILEQMRAKAKVGDVAGKLAAAFPARFASLEHALARVSEVADRYK